jgi:methionine synthase I (cobalamin-dependent)
MPTAQLIADLIAAGPVLLDGAWGTQMQSRGLAPGETPDFWNLQHPDRVEEVARCYVDAGSQIILTNTFRASRIALARHPEVDRVVEVNQAGVEISRRAAGDRARVFASIGPSGKQLITGEVDPEGLRASFAEQAEALASGQPDGIVIETMSDLTEARLAIEAAKATGLPVVACMAFDSGKKLDRTMMGVTPTQAAEELSAAGADVVGANCGAGIDEYIPVCAGLAAATDRPIWIKPNAGLPQLRGTEVFYPTTAEEFAGKLPLLLKAGASFIGGCCGSDPSFIEAMRRKLAG